VVDAPKAGLRSPSRRAVADAVQGFLAELTDDPAVMNDWSEEETDNPLLANDRNYYKVEKWTKDGTKVDRILYAGSNLDKAHQLFAEAVKHRRRITLTIRQRTRVL
jgi:hypothetical protein